MILWSDSIYFQICCCCSVAQWCLVLCNPKDCSMPGLSVHHQLLEFTQTHFHWVGDAIQPSHPLLSPSPPAFNLSQHQGLFIFFFCFFFLILKSLILTGVPKHEPPLPPPSPLHLCGSSPCTSPKHAVSCVRHRLAIQYMIVYMLKCHSPKSSHPLPLPLSPKVRYTHLCLFSCLAYRVVFLNSIYMC